MLLPAPYAWFEPVLVASIVVFGGLPYFGVVNVSMTLTPSAITAPAQQ